MRGGLGLHYDHLEMALLADFGVMVEEVPGVGVEEHSALQTMLRVARERSAEQLVPAVSTVLSFRVP